MSYVAVDIPAAPVNRATVLPFSTAFKTPNTCVSLNFDLVIFRSSFLLPILTGKLYFCLVLFYGTLTRPPTSTRSFMVIRPKFYQNYKYRRIAGPTPGLSDPRFIGFFFTNQRVICKSRATILKKEFRM
jgi:hypothetical protein